MSAPRKHPIDDLLATAEESARIMWQSYDDHLRHPSTDPEWDRRSWVLYQKCMDCSVRVWKLKAMKEKVFGEGDNVV